MLGEVLMSAPTCEKLEELVNGYFYSVNYRITGTVVTNIKTGQTIDWMWVVMPGKRNKRWQIRRVQDGKSDR